MAAADQAFAIAAATDAELRAVWGLVQSSIAGVPDQDFCAHLGPTSVVGFLQIASQLACSLTHQSAQAALGYAVACNGYGGSSQNAVNAQNATEPVFRSDAGAYGLSLGPCSDLTPCAWTEDGDPWGTIYVGQGASCLDPEVVKCVAYQVQAAQYAFAQAQAARSACASAPNPANPPSPTFPGTPPVPPPVPPVTIPVNGTFPGTPPLPPLPTPPHHYIPLAAGAAFFDHFKLRTSR